MAEYQYNLVGLRDYLGVEREAAQLLRHKIFSRNKAKLFEDHKEVCCPLPFPLQDLSLLVVMNNLDSYQKELLASLPLWVRRRLLSILPALDLCRLEHTSVATGVDVDEIWKSRQKSVGYVKSQQHGIEMTPGSPFQLKVCNKYPTYSGLMKKEIQSAFNDTKQDDGKETVFSCVSQLLGKLSETETKRTRLSLIRRLSKNNLDEIIRRLISVEGSLVFSNLLSGSMHSPCKTSICGQRVWKKQATALAVHDTPSMYYYAGVENIHLTPEHRRLTSYNRDPLKLLSFLAEDCNLQPSSVYVDIDFIFNSMSSERLTLDSGSSLPSDELSCTSIVNQILCKVVILSLSCGDYSKFGVMLGIVEAAQENSQLKYLICSMSNLYMDVIQPFSTFFSLQNFYQLTLKLEKLSPTMLCKLLYNFMMAPCSHQQKLIIDVKHEVLLPTSIKPSQLAALYKGECLLPSCNAQHKIFKLSQQKEITNLIYLLLQLPTIRLKKIPSVSGDLIHLCSLHPNLITAKLSIDLSSKSLATIRADLVSLLGKQSLQKIVISGDWGPCNDIKLGLVEGLQRRNRSFPLKKVALELESSRNYKMIELEMLCTTIFSLPELENLKLVLGNGFCEIIVQKSQRYEEIVYRSWTRASRVQLKEICLQTYKTEFKQLSLITKKLSFSSKPRMLDYGVGYLYDDTDSYGYGFGFNYDSDSEYY